jgi:hypothetical protein
MATGGPQQKKKEEHCSMAKNAARWFCREKQKYHLHHLDELPGENSPRPSSGHKKKTPELRVLTKHVSVVNLS